MKSRNPNMDLHCFLPLLGLEGLAREQNCLWLQGPSMEFLPWKWVEHLGGGGNRLVILERDSRGILNLDTEACGLC